MSRTKNMCLSPSLKNTLKNWPFADHEHRHSYVIPKIRLMRVGTPKIYTIGYGNQKFDDFVGLLRRFRIDLLVDVRRFPTSKWSEFVKENLETTLPDHGITYVHLRELGGYRGGYREYTRTNDFKAGLKELMRLAGEKSAAIMCVESSPSGCHRRFIAAELKKRGWKVIHIMGKDKLKTS